jgi:Fur family ferric uptake transcriptional regulator
MFSLDHHAREEPFGEALRGAGFRLTRPRQAILDVIARSGGALNPEEIHHRAASLCPSVGLVTVYRTLSLLTELGCVRRVHQDDHCYGYVRANLAHGHHIVCRSCRQVVEFPGSEDIGAIIGEVARRTGFTVDDHLLELMGMCPACQTEATAGGRPPATRGEGSGQ